MLEGATAHPAWNPRVSDRSPANPSPADPGHVDPGPHAYPADGGGKEGSLGLGRGLVNKWGFVPGEDDTLELNLEKRGDALLAWSVSRVTTKAQSSAEGCIMNGQGLQPAPYAAVLGVVIMLPINFMHFCWGSADWIA